VNTVDPSPASTLIDAATLELESILQRREAIAPVGDRLLTTIFIVALLHVILITGVTFVGPVNTNNETAPTLEVLLLNNPSPSREANKDAVYIAQRSQAGIGNAQKKQHAAMPEDSPIAAINQGTQNGNERHNTEAVNGKPSVERIASRAKQSELAYQTGSDTPTGINHSALALSTTPPSPIITISTETELRLSGPLIHEAIVIPDTTESRLAPYLNSWKRKIERIGTLNYPRAARGGNRQGNPVVEVTITANGLLKSATIQRSSGNKSVDQAALTILKRAAPFDPFSTDLKQDYDQLRFAYEWQFITE